MIIEHVLKIKPDYQHQAYNSKNYLQKNWHRNKFSAIKQYLSYLHNLEKFKVLDLGSGSGNFEIYFHHLFKEVQAFDYNNQAVDYLSQKVESKKIPNVFTKIFDITKFDEEDIPDNLDLVLMVDVIEHVDTSSSQRLITSLKSKLNPGGKIIVLTPNYRSPWILIEKILDIFTVVPKFEGAQHLAKYSKKSLTDLFSNCGYKNIYSTTINTFSFLIPFTFLNNYLNKLEFYSRFVYGNLLYSVFQKDLTAEEHINIWNNVYGKDQDSLYKNFFIRSIFDLGHKFIAKNSSNEGNYLDFGSGIGYHIKFENFDLIDNYFCLDKNSNTLDLIPKNPKIKLIHYIESGIELPDNSVSTVIASHILEHVHDLETVLKELTRILKDDGVLNVVLPCDPGYTWNLLTRLSPSRVRLAMAGLDYDKVMSYEHINKVNDVISILEDLFVVEKKKFYPFFLGGVDRNIICCLSLKKKAL